MLESVKRLLEFVGDMNATEINDHIKARPDGFVVSFRIDNDWLGGWNRAVLATVEKIEQEVAERYMELPLDADGVPIRVGDVMEFSAFEIEKPVTRMVDGIGQGVFFAWCGERGYQQHEAKRYRHHHAPTVEDVLLEACKAYHSLLIEGMSDVAHDMPAPSEIIAEYAAKLTLRGDE